MGSHQAQGYISVNLESNHTSKLKSTWFLKKSKKNLEKYTRITCTALLAIDTSTLKAQFTCGVVWAGPGLVRYLYLALVPVPSIINTVAHYIQYILYIHTQYFIRELFNLAKYCTVPPSRNLVFSNFLKFKKTE